jgi:hypothetical protein
MDDRAISEPSSGFVQVLALAGLLAVSGLLTVVLAASLRTNIALGLLDRHISAEIVAASAVRRVLSAINDSDDDLERRVGVGGTSYAMQLFDHDVMASIEGEAGKIDVLRADPAILQRYAENSLLPAPERVALLDALAAARAIDDAPAAMEALYIAFASIGAGDQVDADFTMRSGLAGIDPTLAGERVLQALPDLTEAAVADILRDRRSGEAIHMVTSRYFATGRPLLTVVATVHWTETEQFTKRVPIEITTGGKARVLSNFR